MSSIHIKNIVPIRSFTDTDTSNNTWSLEHITSTSEKLLINHFDNCSANITYNFLYVKDGQGNCTGNLLLMSGNKYKITLVCNKMILYNADGTEQTSPHPILYIYYSNDPNGDATHHGSTKPINCGFGNRCYVTINYTTDKLKEDNATLHFKLKTIQSLKNGQYCNFYGYFTIEIV